MSCLDTQAAIHDPAEPSLCAIQHQLTSNMTSSKPLEYSADLQEFAISAPEYLSQHGQHDVLVTGAVVFDKEGKLLLVQRAADERAFPDCWVSLRRIVVAFDWHCHMSSATGGD